MGIKKELHDISQALQKLLIADAKIKYRDCSNRIILKKEPYQTVRFREICIWLEGNELEQFESKPYYDDLIDFFKGLNR
ncbi:MAG: hypothetical protein UEE41_01550 [Acutalibacteraceae bacterium]|nr:hypothetical protein [Acutalibacteraceae bacterium]